MENNTPPPEKPPSRTGAKIIFLFLALVPIPIGLLLDPLSLLNYSLNNKSGGQFIVFNVFALICCCAGQIGICGGFKKGEWKALIVGVMTGLILWVVEGSIIFFIGCCKGLSQIH